MDIEIASKELYSRLRVYENIIGVSICSESGVKFIKVFLKQVSNPVLKNIPSNYKGISVKIEVTGDIFLQ